MLQIRRATDDDGPIAFEIRLQAIRSQCIGAYTAEQMLTWTRGAAEDGYTALMAKKPFYLGCVEGEPVATGMLDPDHREVGALFVRPGFIGRGIGGQMLEHLEQVALALGIEEVVLDATLNAADFYRSRGYEGSEQSIYHSPTGLDLACIPMVKRLPV